MSNRGANETPEINIERVRHVQEKLEHHKNRREGAAKVTCLQRTFDTPHAVAFETCCFMLIEMILLKAGFTHSPKDAHPILESMVVIGKSPFRGVFVTKFSMTNGKKSQLGETRLRLKRDGHTGLSILPRFLFHTLTVQSYSDIRNFEASYFTFGDS
jgi:hypothetical protein